MSTQIKNSILILLFFLAGRIFLSSVSVYADGSINELITKYNQAGADEERKKAFIDLCKFEPKTSDDVNQLRSIFNSKSYDEHLFEAATESLRRMHDPSFDKQLIEILKDETPYLDKAVKKDFQGKTEGERTRRGTNILFIIQNLGLLKSQNAVPILKDYLKYPGFNYYASEALAMIGDKSASSELRDRATKGEDVNYAGRGSSEAMNVIRDLQNKSKKDKWPKIAKQIFFIRDRSTKPYLKQLLNHEETYVRWEAADKLRAIVDDNDVPTIIEMTKNPVISFVLKVSMQYRI